MYGKSDTSSAERGDYLIHRDMVRLEESSNATWGIGKKHSSMVAITFSSLAQNLQRPAWLEFVPSLDQVAFFGLIWWSPESGGTPCWQSLYLEGSVSFLQLINQGIWMQ